jgi:hypothetical protein
MHAHPPTLHSPSTPFQAIPHAQSRTHAHTHTCTHTHTLHIHTHTHTHTHTRTHTHTHTHTRTLHTRAQASFEPLGLTIAVAKDRAIESLMQVRMGVWVWVRMGMGEWVGGWMWVEGVK